jgi:hypothetical protein
MNTTIIKVAGQKAISVTYRFYVTCYQPDKGTSIVINKVSLMRGALGVFNTVIPQANFVNYRSF